MERVLAASAVITDEGGRVLLVLRGKEPERGRWTVPGGSLEPGESLAEAAAREVFEETGLVVEVGRRLWVVEISTPGGRVYEVHDFAATVIGGVLRPGDDAADARWFAPADLDEVPLTHDLRGYLARAGVLPVQDSSRGTVPGGEFVGVHGDPDVVYRSVSGVEGDDSEDGPGT